MYCQVHKVAPNSDIFSNEIKLINTLINTNLLSMILVVNNLIYLEIRDRSGCRMAGLMQKDSDLHSCHVHKRSCVRA